VQTKSIFKKLRLEKPSPLPSGAKARSLQRPTGTAEAVP
jgi:hypothetical protein